MKKKIVSFLTLCCLILPCFFAVACKDKEKEPKPTKAYTYSVVLKNAKGFIDENALKTEYDYKKEENVSWINSDNDYSISVTRTSTLSDSLDISLLEGYDYSNLKFSVNSESADGEIKSGNKTGCENEAYLTDRQFHYEYKDMKSDTTLEVDFSDCKWAKVSIDFSELSSQGITCYTASDEFVTINTSTTSALQEVSSSVVEADYGTIFAFDCAQKLVFKSETSELFQDLTYAKYASRYYLSEDNIIQYFTAKQNGDCKVYNATKDYSKRGTLRVLDSSNLPAYASLEDLQLGTRLSSELEKESYGGSVLNINVISGTKIFMTLDSNAQNYNYYVLDSIDGYMSANKVVAPKTLEATGTVYLEIDITNPDGSPKPAKYLVRAPKAQSNYYIVHTKTSHGEILVANADYVLIGAQNMPSNVVPSGFSGNIFFGFNNEKDVEITPNPYTSDIATDFVLNQNTIIVRTTAYNGSGPSDRVIDTINNSPVTAETITIDCYDVLDERKFYSVDVLYVSDNISDAPVTLNTEDFELFEGETAFYTTNITDPSSWQVLTNQTSLSISGAQTRTIYYYINSSRPDAHLQIQKESGEVVSLSNELRDCFGRHMTGSTTVGDIEIDFSKIRYLDIKPGSYSAFTAKLIREYDKTYHNIKLDGIGDNNLMVSIGSYTENGSSFTKVQNLNKFNIKYNGSEIGGTIYYYFNEPTNKYLVLKDSSGNVVSASAYVMKSVSQELQINGNYVYRLSLVGDYYDIGEEFYLEVVDATYELLDASSQKVEIFDNAEMQENQKQDYLVEGKEYYFVGIEYTEYVIIDEKTKIVIAIEDIEMISNGTNAVYKFTFEFPETLDYVSGTSFKLIVRP